MTWCRRGRWTRHSLPLRPLPRILSPLATALHSQNRLCSFLATALHSRSVIVHLAEFRPERHAFGPSLPRTEHPGDANVPGPSSGPPPPPASLRRCVGGERTRATTHLASAAAASRSAPERMCRSDGQGGRRGAVGATVGTFGGRESHRDGRPSPPHHRGTRHHGQGRLSGRSRNEGTRFEHSCIARTTVPARWSLSAQRPRAARPAGPPPAARPGREEQPRHRGSPLRQAGP